MKNKKIVIPLLILVLLTAGAGGTYWYFKSQHTPPHQTLKPYEINYGPATEEQKNPATDTPSVKEQDGAKAPDSNQSSSLAITITSSNINEGILRIRTLITPLVASGECQLTMTMAGQQPLSKTVPIQSLSSSSTCQGFDVDTNNLAKGSWHINLLATSGGMQAQSSKDISIE